MEYYQGNGHVGFQENEIVNKKDKRKLTIQSKLSKLNETFSLERDYYYRNQLHSLQLNLSSIHHGNNEVLVEKVRDFEESRDYELVELRLWEEYQVQRAQKEFFEDIEKANKEHDEMVKLVKEKLYANLEKQIKQLKEDKVLLDLANSHSYNMDGAITNVSDFHKNTRSNTHALKANSSLGYLSDRRGLRRRLDYTSTNNEDSHVSANDSGTNSTSKKKKHQHSTNSSNEDTLLSDAGDLSSILFGRPQKPEKISTRHSSKSYNPPQGLKDDEVSDDLTLLKRFKK